MILKVASSFRDPSGFLFWHNEHLYRAIANNYKRNFSQLIESGLYDTLTKRNQLIPHKTVSKELASNNQRIWSVIQPKFIPFISYPYEWSFSQLKDAALLTLSIQKTAIEYGMSLKDASAYNIQFLNGKPIFIDTLSFETYTLGTTWVAYRQFCQHFLAPLTLMAHADINLNTLLRNYIDGIPLDLTSKLLPFKTKLKPFFQLHIHLHAKAQKKYETKKVSSHKSRSFSKTAFLGLIDNLESGIKKLSWNPGDTEWADYYQDDSYTAAAFTHKKEVISFLVDQIQPNTVWDLGSNNGTFSRIATKKNCSVVSFDIDPTCVENNYLVSKKQNEQYILPLLLDLTNPSPALGWHHKERHSLVDRSPVDLVFALALIHHLAISNNVPFDLIANFFSKITNNLIIEFVPKEDKKVQFLLQSRKDIFDSYTQEHFERTFIKYFKKKEMFQIKGSQRCIYHFSS